MTNKRIAKITLDEIKSSAEDIRKNVEELSWKEIERLREVSVKLANITSTVRLGSLGRE